MIDRAGVIVDEQPRRAGRAHADRVVQRRPAHEARAGDGDRHRGASATSRSSASRSAISCPFRSGARRSCGSATACSRSASRSTSAAARPSPRASSPGSTARCTPTAGPSLAGPAADRRRDQPRQLGRRARRLRRAGSIGINTVAANERRERRLRDRDRRGALRDRRDPQQARRQARLDRRHVRLDRRAQPPPFRSGCRPDTRGAAAVAVFTRQPRRQGRACTRATSSSRSTARPCARRRRMTKAARRAQAGRLDRARRRRPVGAAAGHREGRQATGDARRLNRFEGLALLRRG